MLTNTFRIEGVFAVTLPLNWEAEEGQGLVSLFEPKKGIGAIQISFATRRTGYPPDVDEIKELALVEIKKRGWKIEKAIIQIGETNGSPSCEIEYEDEGGVYWKIWYLGDPRRMALITYNCVTEEREKEAKVVSRIVNSFRWL